MVSKKISFTFILIALEGYNVLASSIATADITVANAGQSQSPCQFVIPAVIKPVFQQESAPCAPVSYGNYAPVPAPIILDGDNSNDNLEELLLLIFALNNRRCGGYGNYGGGCGGCGGGCGGFPNYGYGCSSTCGYGNCGCGCGNNGYSCGSDDCGCGNSQMPKIELLISTDGTTCTGKD